MSRQQRFMESAFMQSAFMLLAAPGKAVALVRTDRGAMRWALAGAVLGLLTATVVWAPAAWLAKAVA
jgi:general secretion pathway protein N